MRLLPRSHLEYFNTPKKAGEGTGIDLLDKHSLHNQDQKTVQVWLFSWDSCLQ